MTKPKNKKNRKRSISIVTHDCPNCGSGEVEKETIEHKETIETIFYCCECDYEKSELNYK